MITLILRRHAKVFSGNQHLSWHGTIQAVQAKPSHKQQVEPTEPNDPFLTCIARRRPHALLFTHTDLNEQADSTLLAFIRLVRRAYIKKHTNVFLGETPESLF